MLAFAALAGTLVAACSDDDSNIQNPPPTVDPTVTPTVAFGDEYTAGRNAVTFELAAADADKTAWTIREKTDAVPTAAEVLASGTPTEGASPWTPTASGLEPATAYVLYAAASKGETLSALARLEVATPGYDQMLTVLDSGKNFVSYHVQVAEGRTYRHLVISKSGFDSFLSFQDEKQAVGSVLQIYGADAAGPADYTARDLDLKGNGQPNDIIAGAEYVVLCCTTDAQGVPDGNYQKSDLRLPDPEILSKTVRVEVVERSADGAVIRCTPDGGIRYIFPHILKKTEVEQMLAQGGEAAVKAAVLKEVGKRVFEFTNPQEWMGLEAETDYVFCVLGIDENGDHTPLVRTGFTTLPPPEVVTENLAFTRAFQCIYYGSNGGGHNFYFILSDKPMSPDEYGFYPDELPCNVVNCDLYTAAPAAGDPAIPDGEYVFGEDMAAGTWHSDYTWAMNYSETEYETEFFFSSGKITVERQGANYRVDIALVSEEGLSYTGSYTGPITFDNQSSPSSRPFAKLLRSSLR